MDERVTPKKKPLVIVAGPTASGKSDNAIRLAKKIGGEIISADSMQVYRMLDIGSAKLTRVQMQGVPHHLIDVLDPRDAFNVTVFQKMAKEAMAGVYGRGHIPILCGGTGFYIGSVLYDVAFTEEASDGRYREELYRLAEAGGAEVLHRMLSELDPESAAAIPANNVKRVARALEYLHETGEKISVHNAREREKESPYDARYFVLFRERSLLYERIDARVDQMLKNGLLSEMRGLVDYGCTPEMTSMQGLGYKQLYQYLLGTVSYEEAVLKIKQETRHFAKRQMTWFKREKDARFIDVDKEDLIDVYETRPFQRGDRAFERSGEKTCAALFES